MKMFLDIFLLRGWKKTKKLCSYKALKKLLPDYVEEIEK
jgi:hypothetical protein